MIELLTVISIMMVIASLTAPALQSMKGAAGVDKAIGDLSGIVERARVYAMANNTYVRVAFGEVATTPDSPSPSTVVITLYPVDGTLDADSATDMADTSKWRSLDRALIINNLQINDDLGQSTDDKPSGSDIGNLQRRVGNLGIVSFKSFIQCNSGGETRVIKGEPSRYIKICLDAPSAQGSKNPFVLRLSGINGNINILRKENL